MAIKVSKLITLYYKPNKNKFVPGVLEGDSVKVPESDVASYLKQGIWFEATPEPEEPKTKKKTKAGEDPEESKGGTKE